MQSIRESKAVQPKETSRLFKRVRSQRGFVIWLTGLSGAGKTTIGRALTQHLTSQGLKAEFLDGDDLRSTISSELGFSKQDREMHARRVAYISHLLSRNGVIAIVALISPYRSFRQYARNLVETFIEVWINCSLETCIKRDPKGLYRKAIEGMVSDMTGLQSPYEQPINPEVRINTDIETPQESVIRIVEYLNEELI